MSLWGSTIIAFMFTWYCYQHLPIMDFGNYGPDKSLTEEMQMVKGNPLTLFKLKHKKSGVIAEFADYPTDYKNWEYIKPTRNVEGELEVIKIRINSTGQETRVLEINEVFKDQWKVLETKTEIFTADEDPKIQQLSAEYYKERDNDYIDMMLSHEQHYFWFVLRDFSEFGDFIQTDAGLVFQQNSYGKSTFKKMNTFAKEAKRADVKFHVLCSEGTYEKIDAFRHGIEAQFLFYVCDDTELKTMIRSSPGLLLLKKDSVINKWHCNDFTTFEEINNQYINK
ncbi:MAG: hypothetical protein ACJA0Q_000661 [Saprospiraceae bacterium]